MLYSIEIIINMYYIRITFSYVNMMNTSHYVMYNLIYILFVLITCKKIVEIYQYNECHVMDKEMKYFYIGIIIL